MRFDSQSSRQSRRRIHIHSVVESPKVFFVILLITTGIALTCGKDRNNPLDPINPDSFRTTAVFQPNGVAVSWEKPQVNGIAGYNVHRSDSENVAGPVVGSTRATNTSFIDKDVWVGHSYYYRVAARDNQDGESKTGPPATAQAKGAKLGLSQTAWAAASSGDSVWVRISNDSTIGKFDWTATSSAGPWLNLSPTKGTSGDSLRLNAQLNSNGSPRSAAIIITSTSAYNSPETLIVTQLASSAQPSLELSMDSIRMPGLGGTSGQIGVTIQNGSDRSFNLVSHAPWLTPSTSSGTTPTTLFTVTALDNFGDSVKNGWIVVTASGCPAESIKVHQPKMAWQPMGNGIRAAWVLALQVHSNQLYAGGGYFVNAAGQRVSSVMKWSGAAEWEPIGVGWDTSANAQVNCLASYNGELYAGGTFVQAGGISSRGIARWNASQWRAVGNGLAPWGTYSGDIGEAKSMVIMGQKLVVAGLFDSAGSLQYTSNIAQWDQFGWGPLTNPTPTNRINSITMYNGDLIAGGDFIQAGGQPANYLARYNSGWSTVGSGTNQSVFSVATYGNELIVGGGFTSAGGIPCSHIARWNGSTWLPLGTGVNGHVYTSISYHGLLFVGGPFTYAGSQQVNGVAYWDGQNWHSTGSGMQGGYSFVETFTVFNDELIAAGSFQTAGRVQCTNIAVLREIDD